MQYVGYHMHLFKLSYNQFNTLHWPIPLLYLFLNVYIFCLIIIILLQHDSLFLFVLTVSRL